MVALNPALLKLAIIYLVPASFGLGRVNESAVTTGLSHWFDVRQVRLHSILLNNLNINIM